MKSMDRILGKVSLFCYIFVLYQIWHLCQYGGIKRHLALLALGILALCISSILWLFARKRRPKSPPEEKGRKKKLFWIEAGIALVATVFFCGMVVYAAIPYHGALSWKIEEWTREKEVWLEHDNFFESGAEGILTDLDHALHLPEDLYLVNGFEVTFDQTGQIQTIDAFFYGTDQSGTERTYLVDYDASKSEKMTVWLDGNASKSYDPDMRLAPMLRILEEASLKDQAEAWDRTYEEERYAILYSGKRSFSTAEGLEYLAGDADGDGRADGTPQTIQQLLSGGEVTGYALSFYLPQRESIPPVRYLMEPAYTSQAALNQEREEQQAQEAKQAEGWTVDRTDGTMYFFLDESRGWRMVVADAAAGSRFYQLEGTADGGATWEMLHTDPFGGQIGVTQGLVFYDENVGIVGLTGASQSQSRLYRTADGGRTFAPISLPMEAVTELPASAKELGYSADDYDYLHMPEEKDGVLSVLASSEASASDGLLFESSDDGKTWIFSGAVNP